MKANQDLRDLAKENDIFYWQIALKMGCSESVVSRMLRQELDQEKKERIRMIIAGIIRERSKGILN